MLDTLPIINCIYLDKNNIKYKVLHIAKNANDCFQQLVVYTNLEQTYDTPIGQIWVIPLHYWNNKNRFIKYEMDCTN